PQEAARRELLEEIGFNVEVLCELGAERYPLLENTFLYSFFCALKMPIEKIVLGEGFDFGLFTLEEIVTGKLYSEKAKKFSPVIPSNYIAEKVSILFNRIKNG
ncbi:MAG: NUDIX hydrolase, partial [Candidatus Omnitrophica bacterium]|nr:NUDIX hydrolase [Candidatus Omnitrophota bacterium]